MDQRSDADLGRKVIPAFQTGAAARFIHLLSLIVLGLSGCGAMSPLSGDGNASNSARDLTGPMKVVLAWQSGASSIHRGAELAPLDLSAFETIEGSTLSDVGFSFEERVRDGVEQVLIAAGLDVDVVANADGDAEYDTVVLFTQERSARVAGRIGEAEYDPCDREAGNTAVIYGGAILDLSYPYSVSEWVTIFVNVTAHEVAHTVGFGHVSRSAVVSAGRTGVVELMLDGHTMDEMRQPQRMIAEQDSCPVTTNARAVAVIPCRLAASSDNR